MLEYCDKVLRGSTFGGPRVFATTYIRWASPDCTGGMHKCSLVLELGQFDLEFSQVNLDSLVETVIRGVDTRKRVVHKGLEGKKGLS